MMMYGETFYGCHTAQHLLQESKIKVKKDGLWKQRTHKIRKIGDSVSVSFFICNTVVCEAAYTPSAGLWYSIFKITRMGSMIPKETRQSEGQLYPPPQNDKIQGSNWWPSIMTLTLCLHCWVMGSAHHLIKANIWPKFNKKIFQRVQEIWSEHEIPGSLMTFNCDLDLESACLSYRFCTSPH